MSACIDLTGGTFGRLTVLTKAGSYSGGDVLWSCRCDCGNITVVVGYDLKNGHTKSCGCLRQYVSRIKSTKHGFSRKNSKIYWAWINMRSRCNNSNNAGYLWYGERGIKVCRRWNKFENFLEDMGRPPTKNHSIDRINNDGNYCKSNCRWATRKQQDTNKINTWKITYDGKTKLAVTWANQYKINYGTLWARIHKLNWSAEKSLTTPIRGQRKESRT